MHAMKVQHSPAAEDDILKSFLYIEVVQPLILTRVHPLCSFSFEPLSDVSHSFSKSYWSSAVTMTTSAK